MRMIDCFPSWLTGHGLFHKINDWAPWRNDESITAQSLDIEYFGNRSGYRETSPLLDKLCGFPNEIPLSETNVNRINDVVKSMFSLSWTKLWNAMNAEYNPLENYRMTEEEDNTITKDSELNKYKDSSETTTVNAKSKTEGNVQNKLVPFGGNASVMTDESDTEATTTTLQADNESKTTHDGVDSDLIHGTDVVDRELTRSGNIGVTTSQQMLESEIELRKKHYFDAIFADLDAVLTAPIWRN